MATVQVAEFKEQPEATTADATEAKVQFTQARQRAPETKDASAELKAATSSALPMRSAGEAQAEADALKQLPDRTKKRLSGYLSVGTQDPAATAPPVSGST